MVPCSSPLEAIEVQVDASVLLAERRTISKKRDSHQRDLRQYTHILKIENAKSRLTESDFIEELRRRKSNSIQGRMVNVVTGCKVPW
jgi:hypothetical protein